MPAVSRENFVGVFSVRDGIFLHRREEATKNQGVSLASAEVENLVEMVVSVMRMEEHPLLPKLLKRSPFEAEFSTTRTIELRRKGQTPGSGLQLSFDEGDDLIWLVRQTQSGLLADTQHTGNTRHHAYNPTPDPPFDGRG